MADWLFRAPIAEKPGKMKSFCCIFIVAFVIVGLSACTKRPNDFEQKTFLLTNGLTKTAVSNIFVGFPVTSYEEEGFVSLDVTKRFQTNETSKGWIMYSQKRGFDPLWTEFCWVWFDADGIIIAYKYQLGD